MAERRSGFRKEFAQFRADAMAQYADIRAQFEQVDARFERADARFASIEDRLDELRRHMDVIAESLHAEIRLVAEGQQNVLEICMRSDERLAARIEQVNSVLGDAIRLSYSELDRRLRSVESAVQH